jgi:GrpB-like predicted nucleotidyltransferase (UPF0157 family)
MLSGGICKRGVHILRRTKILPWSVTWAFSYKIEEELLMEIVKEDMVDIFHIGSTSIPTIGYAKPIIDLLLVVKEIAKVDQYNERLLQKGYLAKGENGIVGRRYFSKGQNERTHHLHIYQVGSEQIRAHLDFKEYLLHHSTDAQKYGELKIHLARQFPEEHGKYQEGKQAFMNELAVRAKVWASERNSGANSL